MYKCIYKAAWHVSSYSLRHYALFLCCSITFYQRAIFTIELKFLTYKTIFFLGFKHSSFTIVYSGHLLSRKSLIYKPQFRINRTHSISNVYFQDILCINIFLTNNFFFLIFVPQIYFRCPSRTKRRRSKWYYFGPFDKLIGLYV